MFGKLFRALKPGGSLWISDLITHDALALNQLFEDCYGEYLETLGGKAYREKVFTYIAHEDTPRSLFYQLTLLKNVGFKEVKFFIRILVSRHLAGLKVCKIAYCCSIDQV
ncbi:MAG: hypothetical protein ACOH2A_03825 [Sphingobacteriaceae bacterium]